MALQTSGRIDVSDINTELSRSPTSYFFMGSSTSRILSNKPTGTVKFSDFYGKSSIPYATSYLGFGNSSWLIDGYGNGTAYYAGRLLGSYSVGRSGSVTYVYTGDAYRPAGQYIAYNNQSTEWFNFPVSTSAVAQRLKVTARYGSGSWSLVSQFWLYDQNNTQIDYVQGGGDRGYGCGSVITRTAYVDIAPGQQPRFRVQCYSGWQGDYNYRPCFESLISLQVEFNNWL